MIIHNLENLKKIKRIDELDKTKPISLEKTYKVVPNKALGSKGSFEKSNKHSIYFYEIANDADQIQVSDLSIYGAVHPPYEVIADDIKNHQDRGEWIVCGFCTFEENDETQCKFISEGIFTVDDFRKHAELKSVDKIEIEINVCRDFFKKHPEKKLYFAISSDDRPNVTTTKFITEGQVYFVEEPVAEAIYNGDRLRESRILCGRVVCDGETIDDGIFLWTSPSKIVYSQNMDYQSYRVVFYKSKLKYHSEILSSRFFEDPRNMLPARKKILLKKLGRYEPVGFFDLCVPVYPKKDRRFDTYVWAKNILSNERALEKDINLEKDTYCYENLLKYKSHHEYENIFDGFSLNELYPDIESLGNKSPKEVAKEIVRNLLRKPKGRRCISIDPSDVLESLMLGPIHIADKLKHKGSSEEEKRIRLEQDYLYSMVYFGPSVSSSESSLSGDGYFYYDAPIHIDAPKLKLPDEYQDIKTKYDKLLRALYCNANVQNGDSEKKDISGCEAMRNLLDKIFKEVSSYGVNIDYVFCDFEVMRNTANDMKIKHRLPSSDTEFINNPAYDFVIPPDEDDIPLTDKATDKSEEKRWNVWNALWASLKKRKDMEVPGSYRDIFNKLKQRGFVILNSKFRLDSVAISNVDQYGYVYAQTYKERRNINIWDQVALEYSAGLFDEYMMAPIRKYSKKVRCSLHAVEEHKGYIHNSDEFERYLGGSVKLPPTMYSAPRIYVSRSQDIYKRCMDNWIALPKDNSPFAALVGTINNIRAARLSNLDKQNQPIFASVHYWIWTLCKTHELLSNDFTELQKLDEKNKEIEYQIKALENKKQTDEVKQQIDELKEQSKTLLKNFNSKKEKFIVLCNSENVSKLAKRCHEYYKELLIHSWFCNPDIMYAYLNYHDHRAAHTFFDHFVFRNKPNADMVFEKISEQEYCWETYRYIQDIANEIQKNTKKCSMKPIVSTLASETNPFLLTGVRIGRIKLYRFTVNDNVDVDFYPSEPLPSKPYSLKLCDIVRLPVSKLRDLGFILGKKKVFFRDALLLDCSMSKGRLSKNGPKGFWIATPWFVTPKITTDYRLYQKNPAIDMKMASYDFNSGWQSRIFVNNKDLDKNNDKIPIEEHRIIPYTWLNRPEIVSVFGELARKQKMMTSVTFDKVDENKTVLGVTFNPKGHFKAGKEYVFERSYNIDSPRDEEQQVYAPLISGNFVVPAKLKVYSGDRPVTYIDIYSGATQYVSWYKSYIQGMNFRVDVFRESDGVNISRVNKACNVAYANLPVDTSCDDFLRLRVSWLNATEHRQSYKVICAPRFEKTIRFPLKLFRRSYDIPAGSEEYKLYKIGRAGSFGSFLDVYVAQNGKRELVYSIPINGR